MFRKWVQKLISSKFSQSVLIRKRSVCIYLEGCMERIENQNFVVEISNIYNIYYEKSNFTTILTLTKKTIVLALNNIVQTKLALKHNKTIQ